MRSINHRPIKIITAGRFRIGSLALFGDLLSRVHDASHPDLYCAGHNYFWLCSFKPGAATSDPIIEGRGILRIISEQIDELLWFVDKLF